MKIFKTSSRVAEHLVRTLDHEAMRKGELCETRYEGVTVRKSLMRGKYYVYVKDCAELPGEFSVTEINHGHAELLWSKPRAKRSKKNAVLAGNKCHGKRKADRKAGADSQCHCSDPI